MIRFLTFHLSFLTVVLFFNAPIHAAGVQNMYDSSPLAFTRTTNTSDNARYLAHSRECSMQFSRSGVSYRFQSKTDTAPKMESEFTVCFPGSHTDVNLSGEKRLDWPSHFLVGDNPEHWHTNAPNYARIRYAGLYDGIDLLYYGNHRTLKYDFIVKSGAKPEAIRVKYNTGDGSTFSLGDSGELIIKTRTGAITEQPPYCYQIIDGAEIERACRYHFTDSENGEFTFVVDDYDSAHELVIDPELTYSSYIGDANDEEGNGIVVDSIGCVYITGQAETGYPTSPGAYDSAIDGGSEVFVTAFNPDGSIKYSTYVGGASTDYGEAIVIDSNKRPCITGVTFPNGAGFFPTVNQRQTFPGNWVYCGFICQLDADGAGIRYSSYIGGNSHTYPKSIAVDSADNLYVTGNTQATNLPMTPGSYDTGHNGGNDVFVQKYNPSLSGNASLLYSTYIGGNDTDLGLDIAVDVAGCSYIAGYTNNGLSDYPTTPGAYDTNISGYDGFATKLSADGSSLVFSTYIGGSDSDYARAVAVHTNGTVYVAGDTDSNNFPTVGPYDNAIDGSKDCFAAILSSDGSSLSYSTYLGGAGGLEYAYGVRADTSGRIHVTGKTPSASFPVSGDAHQNTNAGGDDAFYAILDPTAGAGGLVYSTYLGGTGNDQANDIVIDAAGDNAFITGRAGAGYPTSANANDANYNGGTDVFVSRIGPAASPPPSTVPTLDEWGIILFMLMTAFAAHYVMKHRQTA